MPIPASRTSTINAFQPTLHHRQRGMPGLIYLQRRHRDVSLGNGVKVSTWSCVVLWARRTHPVDRTSVRVLCRYDGLGGMSKPQSRSTKSAHVRERQVRHVDIKDQRTLERLAQ